jgi:transcriptional regulator with XRE-family HTH domain
MAATDRDARERFAANVERLRQRSGLSAEALAERSQVDPGEIEAIFRGDVEARAGTIYRLAGALGVEPEELFDGVAWVPPRDGGPGYVVEKPDGD